MVARWLTVIAIVLVVAYLVAPGSQAPAVLKAIGGASASNIRALAGGAYVGGPGAAFSNPKDY